MEPRAVTIVDGLDNLETEDRRIDIYDGDIGLQLLYENRETGEEHHLVRYPAGLKSQPHRHTAAKTIVVLEGRLKVNDEIIGPHAFCHVEAGQPHSHEPADNEGCLFVVIFHAPFDVERVETHE